MKNPPTKAELLVALRIAAKGFNDLAGTFRRSGKLPDARAARVLAAAMRRAGKG
jgi:hypothetical protein